MRWISCFFILLALQAFAGENKIQVDGSERSYLVFTPENLPAQKSPLMIVLHGGTGNANHSSATMGMNDVAQKNKFLVAYPNGTGTLLGENRRVWNAGGCCAIAQRKNINDVKFIDQMIKDIEKKYQVDEKRIYVTGESNGAMLTYRLVCELPDVFAAAVAVSGSLMIDDCHAGQKIAFLDIHGSADKNVPYNGGKGVGLSDVSFRAIPDSISILTKLRNCEKPTQKTLANGDKETNYKCDPSGPVRTRWIKEGGHAWSIASGPGKNSDFSAAAEVWNFAKEFSRH